MTREEELRAAFSEGANALAKAVEGKVRGGLVFNVDKAFAASETAKRLEQGK